MLIDETATPIIRTERLVLRPLLRRDLEALTELWTDKRVAASMDDFGPRDAAGVARWLVDTMAARDDATSVQLAIEADSELAGWLGLGRSSRGVADWDLGYAAHPAHRAKGYLSEALAAALPAVRERAGVRDLWGECHADNTASAHVMASAGMREIAPGDDGQRRFVWPPEADGMRERASDR